MYNIYNLSIKKNITLFIILLLSIQGCSTLSVRTRMVEIKSGSIAISVKGNGSPAVVFESGLGVNKETWSAVFNAVVKTNKVFAYDRAGLGESPSSSASRDSCTIAKELHESLIASNVKPPYVLVGHSMGGLYQYVFAILYPDEVAGLVLVDSYFPEPWEHKAQIPVPKEYLLLNDNKKPNYLIRLLNRLEDKYTTGGRESTKRDVCLESIDITKAVTFPVRMITAVKDENVPGISLAWLRKRDRSRQEEWFHTLGKTTPVRQVNSGHFIQEDRPDIVIEEILKLISKIKRK